MAAGIPDGAPGATVEVGKKAFDPLKLAQYRDFDEVRVTRSYCLRGLSPWCKYVCAFVCVCVCVCAL